MRALYAIGAIFLAAGCKLFLSDTVVIVASISGAACYVVYETTLLLRDLGGSERNANSHTGSEQNPPHQ